jgi:hypothetical protein
MRFLAIPALTLICAMPAAAQDADTALVGELMAFHGSQAIVEAMTTHCYENTGLDPAFQTANANWYLRNIGFLELADRVVARLGGASEEGIEAAQVYGGTQIMSAYNQADDKLVFCQAFLEQVDSGALDIDKALPDALKRAQDIAAE